MSTIDSSFGVVANVHQQDLAVLTKIGEKLQALPSPRMRVDYFSSFQIQMQKKLQEYCEIHQEEEKFSLLLIELAFLYQLFEQALPEIEQLICQARELTGAHRFYYDQGGLIYYQAELLNQLQDHQSPLSLDLFPPSPIKVEDLSEQTKARWTKRFYDHFDEYAEFYPIGGAADRLNSTLEQDATPLPAAKLCFCDQFLLQRLFADLKAKEEVYFKLTGKRVDVPVVLMTSLEQKNHTIIQELLESHSYFGKDEKKVKIISQPLVPASDEKGRWIFLSDEKIMLRPAGHGVFWQLLAKEGILTWLEEMNIKRALIRQINNPIAGLDDLLTLLVGSGIESDKEFGFASTYFEQTAKGAQEGCNVVMRTKQEKGFSYALSNLEYTHPEFAKEGEKEWYKIANANLLYIDLGKSKEKINQFVPPPFINRKKTKISGNGILEEKVVVRLETTIQSISEHFTHLEQNALEVPHEELPAFLLLQKRSKTLSAIKRIGAQGGDFEKDTPELCLYHFQNEARDLLSRAGFRLPNLEKRKNGFPFIFLYSPLLGPYYSVILQKLRGGVLEEGSEFLCDLGEVDIENLHLSGSLLLRSTNPHLPPSGFVQIKNVKVTNEGLVERVIQPQYWKGNASRKEAVEIHLGQQAELDIEGVQLKSSYRFDVPDHHRLVVRQRGGEIASKLEKISKSTFWNYRLQQEGFLLQKEQSK